MENSKSHVNTLQEQRYLKALVKGTGSQPVLLKTRVTRSRTTCGLKTPSELQSGTRKRGLSGAGSCASFCATWSEAHS